MIQSREEFREGLLGLVRFYAKFGRTRSARKKARIALASAKTGSFYATIDLLLSLVQGYAQMITEEPRPRPLAGSRKVAMENLIYRSIAFDRDIPEKPLRTLSPEHLLAVKAGWVFMVNLASPTDPGPVNCLTSALWNWDGIRRFAIDPAADIRLIHRIPIRRLDDPFGAWTLSEPYGCSACRGIPLRGPCADKCPAPEICGSEGRTVRLERMIRSQSEEARKLSIHWSRVWQGAGRKVRPHPPLDAVLQITKTLEAIAPKLRLTEFDPTSLAKRLLSEPALASAPIDVADVENVLDSLISISSAWQGGARFFRARADPDLMFTEIAGNRERLSSITQDPVFPLLVESLNGLSRHRVFKRWIYAQINSRLDTFDEAERKRKSRNRELKRGGRFKGGQSYSRGARCVRDVFR